jgi:hypothetical protein
MCSALNNRESTGHSVSKAMPDRCTVIARSNRPPMLMSQYTWRFQCTSTIT